MMRGLCQILAAAAGMGLSGCGAPEAPKVQPAFYRDLAQPGATLDPTTATEIINAYRKGNGLSPLVWDANLQRVAEQEARRLAERGDLADGGGAGLRAALAGAGLPPDATRRSVTGGYHSFADAFSGWRGAPGHDAVLRAQEGRRLGIAAVARPGSRHRVYWVMLVSAR